MEGRKEAAYRRSWRLWRSADAHRNLSRQDLLRESRSWRYSRRKILRPDEFSGIGRSLDRDFPLCCALFARAIFWTALASKDCLYSLQVQPHAAAVNQSLKDLFHVAANLEDEVAAVLNLVV